MASPVFSLVWSVSFCAGVAFAVHQHDLVKEEAGRLELEALAQDCTMKYGTDSEKCIYLRKKLSECINCKLD